MTTRPNRWSDHDGQAAIDKKQGSYYRTWRPSVTETPGGGLFVSTKIDHIRGGGAQDDHNQLEMEFNSEGQLLTVRSVIDFADTPQFDTGLIRAAGELDSEKTGKIAELSAKVANSLIKFFEDRTEHGGRVNFPAIVRHNINVIAACVTEDYAESTYDITVVTRNVDSGGTDADVYIRLFGANGNSGEVPLVNERDNFERGQTDGFTPRRLTKDLGKLKEVRIWHNNTGEKPGWFLESVTVLNRATGETGFFPCHWWLALDGDDGLIHRILVPETELTTYEIRVVTRDIDNAGTDANVYIWLFGAHGDSGERLLDIEGIDNFNRGKTDDFTLELKDLGDLREVRIRHDNTGEKPGWFLESVTVRNRATGQSWFFPCHRWLARDEVDGRTDIQLFPMR